MPTPIDSSSPQQAAASTDKPPVAVLPATPGSKLAALRADYSRLKAELAEIEPQYEKLTNQLKEVKDAIISAARSGIPGQWSIDIWTPGHDAPMEVRGHPHRTFNSKAFQKEHPSLYVSYCTWPERWSVK